MNNPCQEIFLKYNPGKCNIGHLCSICKEQIVWDKDDICGRCILKKLNFGEGVALCHRNEIYATCVVDGLEEWYWYCGCVQMGGQYMTCIDNYIQHLIDAFDKHAPRMIRIMTVLGVDPIIKYQEKIRFIAEKRIQRYIDGLVETWR